MSCHRSRAVARQTSPAEQAAVAVEEVVAGTADAIVENCQAKVGEIISATFNVPAYEQNGYYDKIHEKLEKVTP